MKTRTWIGIALGGLLANLSAQEPTHTKAYSSNFEENLNIKMWSEPRLETAPNGRQFLGRYGHRETLYQSLDKLPEHRYIRLRFDLITAISWDGSSERWGPDNWCVMVKGGPLLMLSSFCNKRKVLDPDRIARGDQATQPHIQSYPDEFPTAAHEAATGGSEEEPALGYKFFRGDLETTDSLYKIDITFPHTGEELVLQYAGYLDSGGVKFEGWAIDKVVIDTIDKAAPQTDEQLEALWKQLSGKDPVAANQALWKLVAAGPEAAAFVGKRYQAFLKGDAGGPKKFDPELVAKFEMLVEKVVSDVFVTRQQARKDLLDLGPDALDMINAHIKKTDDPEVKKALGVVVKKFQQKNAAISPEKQLELVRSRVGHIQRIFATYANGYKITSSVKQIKNHPDSIGAAADGFVPKTSMQNNVPRFSWHPKIGGEAWLQYDFPKARTISKAEVFWLIPHSIKQLPQSWRVDFLDADGSWKAVEAKGNYPLQADQMNQITFKAVTTGAVRLVAQLPESGTGGVLEFRVSDEKQQ